ncbi:MAG TPA: hypothetical protein PLZ84_04100 [Clostridia bacterium]|nr:hypothetical protein [Clostridia bacterium]
MPDGSKYCGFCGARAAGQDGTQQQYAAPQPQPSYAPPYNSAELTRPLRIGEYLLIMIVSAIPIVGIIMLFVWGFGSNVNENKKNYCKASLIMIAIGLVLSFIFSALIISMIYAFINSFTGVYF